MHYKRSRQARIDIPVVSHMGARPNVLARSGFGHFCNDGARELRSGHAGFFNK
jgi:hypothetical protein